MGEVITLICDRCNHSFRANYIGVMCAVCQRADRETLWARPITAMEIRFCYERSTIDYYGHG